MTDQSVRQSANSVQPIRSQVQSDSVYLFHDGDIVAEKEKHHVMVRDPEVQTDEILNFLKFHTVQATKYDVNDLMNSPISDDEVSVTFGTGSGSPGPDNISCT